MLQKKFVISADTSADFYQSQYEASGIHYILMGVVYNGQEKFEVYNSEKEFETFYENLKKGALPTTTQLNYFELSEYFKSVLAKEPEGDIIHVTLSSGLSGTHNNALMAASDLNEKLVGRKIYVFDSLSATTGVALQLDRLVEMRDAGIETEVALARLQEVRDHEQTWAMIGDLFHLKRGGRISGVKAVLGKMFHANPIILISSNGKLQVQNTIKGNRKAVAYLLEMLQKHGVEAKDNFFDRPLYLVRTSKNDTYDFLKQELKRRYPKLVIKESIVGPVIGAHVGCGASIIFFEGAPRFKI